MNVWRVCGCVRVRLWCAGKPDDAVQRPLRLAPPLRRRLLREGLLAGTLLLSPRVRVRTCVSCRVSEADDGNRRDQISSPEAPHSVVGFIPFRPVSLFHSFKSHPIIAMEVPPPPAPFQPPASQNSPRVSCRVVCGACRVVSWRVVSWAATTRSSP